MSTKADMAVPAARAAPPHRGARREPTDWRALAIQAALIAALAALFWFIGSNVAANVTRLNIQTGFAFLERPAGFGIAQHLIDYSEGSTYFRAFLVGLSNTILLAGLAALLSSLLGLIVGLTRLAKNRLLAGLATAYIEGIRNIPLLLILFYVYFAIIATLPGPRQSLSFLGIAFLNKRGFYFPAPVAEAGFSLFTAALVLGFALCLVLLKLGQWHRIDTGRRSVWSRLAPMVAIALPLGAWLALGAPLRWDIPELRGLNLQGGAVINPEFVAMTIGLTIYGAAYTAEIVRAGVQSVERGQAEAGFALGLPPRRVYAHIVVPQALRAIVPPLIGQYIHLLKNSSLAAAIGYPDLMLVFAGTALNQTGQPIEIMAITMGTYLALCLSLAAVGNLVNKRVQIVER